MSTPVLYKWICSRGKVTLRDSSGAALRMVGTTTDITALRELAAQLQQTNDLTTNLTDQVGGLVFQYRETAAGQGRFTYASAGIREIYELMPSDVSDNVDAIDALIDPRDLPTLRRSWRKSAEKLTPWRLEYRVRLPKEGLRWRTGDARPQRLPDGEPCDHRAPSARPA
ncbi:PAS domain-containing protein [Robbsia sp. KACC 23696]|uniref:PAS domain-containing protein n=1 Tax=Robbsia sp. KACC 23696 TaxID=3149231 RepID=UPI00325BDFC5